MANDLKNKVIVITGGAAGIGYEIGDKFLQEGAKIVIVLDVNEKQGAEALKGLNSKHGNNRSTFIKCNVTADLEVVYEKIINTYTRVDVLVNNAGILDHLSPKKTIDTNVTAVIEFSLKFWEHMRKDKGGNGGTIMNLSSIYGFRVDPFLPVYQASKFAVMGFTRSIGYLYNYNRTGVRVVAINPGFTETASASAPKTIPDKQLQDDFVKFLKEQPWQKVEAVGKAAVEIFEKAESGTTWMIEGSRAIVEVK